MHATSSVSPTSGPGSPRRQRAGGRRDGRRRPLIPTAWLLALAMVAAAFPGSATASALTRSKAAARRHGPPLPITICCAWGSTWSYNPYNSYFLGIVAYGLVDLPLAVQVPPAITDYSPQVAKSWKASGDTLTVHLRPGLRWQNGKPVTSRDVYDTVLLDGTNGGLWADLTNVAAPTPHQVVFTVRPGIPMVLAEQALLGMTPFPASVYGKFVSRSLKADEIAYYNKDATDPAAATNMAQYKAIGKVFSSLANFTPKSLVGDGPFRLANVTTLEASLKSWPGFYDASKVHVSGLAFYNGLTNQVTYSWMESGKVAFNWSYMPPPIVSQVLKVPHVHIDLTSPQGEYIVEFNDHSYPLDITKVRQALAYVIPRDKMVLLAYGTKYPDGVPEARPDGVTPTVQKLYLTPKQIGGLNRYALNTTRASALLRSAGFHKSGNRWLMPDGKPFTLNLDVNAAWSDVELSFKAAATTLSNFGIKSTVTSVPGATLGGDMARGNFQVAVNLPSNLDPLTEFDDMMGSGNNFTTLGANAGDRGMGYGPKEVVPGLGNVAVAPTIDRQATSTAPGKQMNQLVWDWARLVNRQVPYLQYGNKVWQMAFSTAIFTGWPSKSSNLWNTIGYNFGGGWLLLFEDGHLHAK